jgi:hypothetical protein
MALAERIGNQALAAEAGTLGHLLGVTGRLSEA